PVADRRDAIRIGDQSCSWEQAAGAAAAVARRIAGAPAAAVPATAELSTVVAVLGGLAAGVPVVPVPADSGPQETAHLLTDSGAMVWLGPDPPASAGRLERVPADPAARADPAGAEPPGD